MFSSLVSPPRPRHSALAVLLLLGAAWACGHKKPPIPPPRMIPVNTFALRAHIRGNEAVIRFPYPLTNYRGATLDGVSKVEVYRSVQALPAEVVTLHDQQVLDFAVAVATYEEELAAWQERHGIAPPPVAGVEGTAEGGSPIEPTEVTGETPEAPEPDAAEDAAPVFDGPADEAAGVDDSLVEPDAPMPPDIASGEASAGDSTATAEGAEETVDEDPIPTHPGAAPKITDLVFVDPRELERSGDIVLTLEGETLAGSILGSEVFARQPLDVAPVAVAADEGAVLAYAFAIKTYSLKGLASGLSNVAKVVPRGQPEAPSDLDLKPLPRGIELSWRVEAPPASGFKVYRRDAQVKAYGDPLFTVPDGAVTSWTDWGAVLGTRYIYGIVAVATTDPLVESALSAEREILYRDRFPPMVPTNVVAFPEPGQVRVLWDVSDEEDLAGYIVYKRLAGGDARAIQEEPLDAGEYVDGDVAPGQLLLYAVVAVDTSGNRSEASLEVQVRVP